MSAAGMFVERLRAAQAMFHAGSRFDRSKSQTNAWRSPGIRGPYVANRVGLMKQVERRATGAIAARRGRRSAVASSDVKIARLYAHLPHR